MVAVSSRISSTVVEVAPVLAAAGADRGSTTWSSTLRYIRIGAVTLSRSAVTTFQNFTSEAQRDDRRAVVGRLFDARLLDVAADATAGTGPPS